MNNQLLLLLSIIKMLVGIRKPCNKNMVELNYTFKDNLISKEGENRETKLMSPYQSLINKQN